MMSLGKYLSFYLWCWSCNFLVCIQFTGDKSFTCSVEIVLLFQIFSFLQFLILECVGLIVFLSCRGSHSIESVSVLCQWGIGGVCSYCWIIYIWSSTNHISFTGWTEGIEFNYMPEVISFCVQTEFLSAYNMTFEAILWSLKSCNA